MGYGRPMTVEDHLRAARTNPAAMPALCHALVGSNIIVLGSIEDDGQATGEAQLDVLHYLSGADQVMPVFTGPQYVDLAVREDPNCGKLKAITVQGTYLLEKVSDAVLVLVNPWSDVEVEIASRDVRAAIGPGGTPGR